MSDRLTLIVIERLSGLDWSRATLDLVEELGLRDAFLMEPPGFGAVTIHCGLGDGVPRVLDKIPAYTVGQTLRVFSEVQGKASFEHLPNRAAEAYLRVVRPGFLVGLLRA